MSVTENGMKNIRPIAPCLWFDTQAEEAARFYTGIFPNSSIGSIARYSDAGQEIHGKAPGSVMTVDFELNGQRFTGLNGGPIFKFNEAISFQVDCEDQAEIDYYWDRLKEGGEESQCGWLRDKYGVSWQVSPAEMPKFFADSESDGAKRAMEAMLKMKKLDIAELRRAYEG